MMIKMNGIETFIVEQTKISLDNIAESQELATVFVEAVRVDALIWGQLARTLGDLGESVLGIF